MPLKTIPADQARTLFKDHLDLLSPGWEKDGRLDPSEMDVDRFLNLDVYGEESFIETIMRSFGCEVSMQYEREACLWRPGLDDPNEEIRRKAKEELTENYLGREDVEGLKTLLKDNDEQVLRRVIEYYDVDREKYLDDLFKKPGTRGPIRDPSPFFELFEERLSHLDPEVRKEVIRLFFYYALRHKDRARIEALLSHADPVIQAAAAGALRGSKGGQMDFSFAVPHLVKMLESPERPVFLNAAMTLKRLAEKRRVDVSAAVPGLNRLLTHPDPFIKITAGQSLKGAAVGGTDITPALGNLRANTRFVGASDYGTQLAQSGAAGALVTYHALRGEWEAVSEFIRSKNPNLSNAAENSLGSLSLFHNVDISPAVPALADDVTRRGLDSQSFYSLQVAQEKGQNIDTAVPALEKLLSSFDPSRKYREKKMTFGRIAEILTWRYLSKKTPKKANPFFRHPLDEVRERAAETVAYYALTHGLGEKLGKFRKSKDPAIQRGIKKGEERVR